MKLMMPQQVLRSILENSVDLLSLATELLRFCRSEREAYERIKDEIRHSNLAEVLTGRAAEVFWQIPGERIPPALRQRLVALTSSVEFRFLAPVLQARSLALGLDNAVGHRLAAAFRNRGQVRIAANDPVPVCRPPWKRIFSRRIAISPDPQNSSPEPDRLPRLCLAPESLGPLQVEIDCVDVDQLGPLLNADSQIVATGIPNQSLREFRSGRHEEGSGKSFFPFAPRDGQAQRNHLLGILHQASLSGAAVLIFPELCVDQECIAALVEAFRRAPGSLRLLVLGSHHTCAEGEPRNECLAAVRGSARLLRHWKYRPFLDTRQKITEGIATSPRKLTIFLSEAWTFTLLICKDLLDSETRSLVEKLGITLVLVPALTPKTSQFEEYAGSLAQSNQALVVIANNPIFPQKKRVHSIFAVPRQTVTKRVLATKRGNSIPGLSSYQIGNGRWRWVDCPKKVD